MVIYYPLFGHQHHQLKRCFDVNVIIPYLSDDFKIELMEFRNLIEQQTALLLVNIRERF